MLFVNRMIHSVTLNNLAINYVDGLWSMLNVIFGTSLSRKSRQAGSGCSEENKTKMDCLSGKGKQINVSLKLKMNFCFITIRESMTLSKTICNYTALPSSLLCCGCDQSNSGYGRPD